METIRSTYQTSKLHVNSSTLGLEDADFEYYKSVNSNSKSNPHSHSIKNVKNDTKKQEKEPLLLSTDQVPSNSSTTNTTNTFRLENISISFPLGQLTSIIGATGSGKTSLLLSLLGECKRIKGSRFVPNPDLMNVQKGNMWNHGIAYVAQTSWLLNATIKENILFGESYDEERYLNTIKACALVRDLENLPGGDLTEIGEKVSLLFSILFITNVY